MWRTKANADNRWVERLSMLLALFVMLAGTSIASNPDGWTTVAAENPGRWFPAPPAPQDEFIYSIPRLPDGRIVVSFQVPLIYDPHTGAWQEGTPHPEIGVPGWRPQTAVVLDDGRLLVLGGSYAHNISPGSYGSSELAAIYDPETDEWADAASMHESRVDPSATLLADGSVLVAGGDHGRGIGIGSSFAMRSSAERYYPNEDRWEMVDEMNEGRHRHSAIGLPAGRVLMIGGQTEERGRPTTAEVFDPATNGWEVINENMPEELLGHAAVLLDGEQVLITGGATANPLGGPGDVVATSWILDVNSGELRSTTPMTTPLYGHSATLLPSGKVLVSGGLMEFPADDGQTASTEIFNPETGEWNPAAAMREARFNHKAVALDLNAQDAAVYVVGGRRNSLFAEAPEVFYETTPSGTDRQPPPADDDAAHSYFPETGHYLSYGFKDFWEQSGGLPAFGFPLTEEFDELIPDTDVMHTVQYFERQRFEYHPENAGTPYEVQLGRLGVSDAEARGLLDTDAFEPVDDEVSGDECVYFPETGHSLCDEFGQYWESHGLEFGDDGVSFRESLALFGYPISEPFTGPETGLETQYFERARFEYHPDNPQEHRVLLGRLGADVVEAQDW